MDLVLQPALLAEASTLSILLAGAILLFWSFRERYLVPWMAGWTAYGLSRLFTVLSHSGTHSPVLAALANASFVLGIALFAATILIYVYRKRLLLPVYGLIFAAMVLGMVRAFLPDAAALRWLFEISWRAVILIASVQLARFAWGRPG